MNSHALRVLEFHRVREILSHYATNQLGRDAIALLEPLSDVGEIATRLGEVKEIGQFLEIARIPLRGLKNVADRVRGLANDGRPANPEDLYDVLELLRGALSVRETLLREPEVYPKLNALGRKVEDLTELREQLERSVGKREGIRDDATPKLAILRQEVRALREKLRERTTRFLSSPKLHKALQSEGVKFKNDRYLLPVKAEYRQSVPGVIRDRSHTGSTLYIEPEELVLEGDQLLDKLDKERNEVQRVLWELTRAVIAVEDRIRVLQHWLARVDVASAGARYTKAFGLNGPSVFKPGDGERFAIELSDARHPYLMWLAAEMEGAGAEVDSVPLETVREKVTPLNIKLDQSVRLLIVTGPNTGGKTVALKTIGLNLLMALSGIPIAAAPGSRVPILTNLFADIGDEQSIEQSLSTFSSHLTQIEAMLDDGDRDSLILLDELGAGTDPLEGASLATALLEWLDHEGWHGVITTHLGSLKEFAYLHDAAENAAMQFDPVNLRPTYRMVTGIPGVSNALEIARRVGFPEEILEVARQKVDAIQAPSQAVIEKMVHSHHRMEKERRRMERLRRRAQGERRAAEAEREEAEAERAAWREEAEVFTDDVIRAARDRMLPLVQKLQSVPAALKPVVNDLLWILKLILSETPLGERREAFARSLKKGDEVYIPKFRERLKVRKINKSERIVTVVLNNMTTEVGFDDISWLDEER